MTRPQRLLACLVLALVIGAMAACDDGGIGIGVSNYGGRWGGGGAGPDIVMGGGPVYR